MGSVSKRIKRNIAQNKYGARFSRRKLQSMAREVDEVKDELDDETYAKKDTSNPNANKP